MRLKQARVCGSGRLGATLSEILIALLVMAIGVTSLLVLFPISVLRAVQATNLTHATQLQQNVVGTQPALSVLRSGTEVWRSEREQLKNVTWLMPSTEYPSSSIPFFRCRVSGDSGSGAQPIWNPSPFGISSATGSVNYPIIGVQPNAVYETIPMQRFVIDPLGWLAMPLLSTESTTESERLDDDFVKLRDCFGNGGSEVSSLVFGAPASPDGPVTVTRPANQRPVVWRLPGIPSRRFDQLPGSASPTPLYGLPPAQLEVILRAQALRTSTLPDSFTSIGEYPVLSAALPTVTLRNAARVEAQLTDGAVGFATRQITLMDTTRRSSWTNPIAAPTGTGSNLTVSLLGTLPVQMQPTDFAWGRLEVSEPRYSTLLSVTRSGGEERVDVVVFFRREFTIEDETCYPANVTAEMDVGRDRLPGLNGANARGAFGSDDQPRDWIMVQFRSDRRPQMKKGGYVCDVDNLEWYRITEIVEGSNLIDSVLDNNSVYPVTTNDDLTFPGGLLPPGAGGSRFARLTLDRPISRSARSEFGAAGANQVPQAFGRVLFMKNIIRVYRNS